MIQNYPKQINLEFTSLLTFYGKSTRYALTLAYRQSYVFCGDISTGKVFQGHSTTFTVFEC